MTVDKYQITREILHFGEQYSLILFLAIIIIIFTFYKLKIFDNTLKKIFQCIQTASFQGMYLGILAYFFVTVKITATQGYFFVLLYIISTLLIYCHRYFLTPLPPLSETNSSLYFNALGSPEPLLSIENDSYDRKALVKKICDLILSKNINSSFIIGINGQWGIGKSTLLKFISQEINSRGIEIALSAWDYRNGERFIEVLLKKIGKEIDNYTGNVNVFSYLFSKLLIQISKEKSIFGFKLNLKLSNIDPKKELLKKLAALKDLHVIIYLDDLDRLNRDDLISILKSINMISDLPKLTYILAYDKEYLYELLFPENINKSINYFSKIVHCEIVLPIPQASTRKKILLNIIREARDEININELERFESFLSNDNLTFYLFNFIQSPRDLRKIISFTIWISLRNNTEKCLDFVDMFILTIVQYKAPMLYDFLAKDSEEIINELCQGSGIPYINYDALQARSSRANIEPNSKNDTFWSIFTKKYSIEKEELIKPLIEYILPQLFNKKVDGREMLVNKKICHPFLYNFYFEYNKSDPSEKFINASKELAQINENNCDIDKYAAFFIKHKDFLNNDWAWNSLISEFPQNSKGSLKFIKGIFGISKTLEYSKENHWDTELSLYARRIYDFKFRSGVDPSQLYDFWNDTTFQIQYGMLAYNIKAITEPNYFNLVYKFKLDDKQKTELNNELTQFASKYFLDKNLDDFNFYDFLGLVSWTNLDEKLTQYILSAIKKNEERLYDLLDIYCSPMFVNLKELDEKFGYSNLRTLIDSMNANNKLDLNANSKYTKMIEIFMNYETVDKFV